MRWHVPPPTRPTLPTENIEPTRPPADPKAELHAIETGLAVIEHEASLRVSRIPTENYLPRWLQQDRLRPNTRSSYALAARQFGAFLGHCEWHRVEPLDIEDWHRAMTEHGYSERSISLKISAVRSFYDFMARMGWVEPNPFDRIRPPRTPPASESIAEKIVSVEQIHQIIYNEPQWKTRLLIECMYYLWGLRVSEALSLRWEIIKRRKKGDGYEVHIRGKGHGKEGKLRIVPVPDWLHKKLTENFGELESTEKFFPYQRRYALRVVKRAGERFVAGFSPHWLRHCAVSHALAAGARVELVQKMVGHERLDATQAYIHLQDGEDSGAYLGEPESTITIESKEFRNG